MRNQKQEQKKNLLEEKVISITRVTKVTQGGRHFRFSATVAVGNRKGLVGIGSGKANEVPEAIKKALQAANKNVCKVALIDNRTVPHEMTAKVGRAVVLIKPAKEGRGIIAGGALRAVFDCLGVQDVVVKSQGSNNPNNMIRAVFSAFAKMNSPKTVAARRGKTVAEIIAGRDGKKLEPVENAEEK